jgi:tetratricopeptide (TPR) repeat protein
LSRSRPAKIPNSKQVRRWPNEARQSDLGNTDFAQVRRPKCWAAMHRQARLDFRRLQLKQIRDLNFADYVLKAKLLLSKGADASAYNAYRLFRAASKMTPGSTLANAMASWCFCLHRIPDIDHDSLAPSEFLRMAKQAVDSIDSDPASLSFAAHALSHYSQDHNTALNLIDRALSAEPYSVDARQASGWVHLYLGDYDVSIMQFTDALRSSPLDYFKHFIYLGLSIANLQADNLNAAWDWVRLSLRERPRANLAVQCTSTLANICGGFPSDLREFNRSREYRDSVYVGMEFHELPFESRRARDLWRLGIIEPGKGVYC